MSLHLRWLVLFPIAVFTCTVKYQTRMECKNERKNFNCENLRGIEVLVLRRVYLQEVNVNPSCLPALRRILMQEPRNGDCTTFPGFNTWVNGESCSNETVSTYHIFFFKPWNFIYFCVWDQCIFLRPTDYAGGHNSSEHYDSQHTPDDSPHIQDDSPHTPDTGISTTAVYYRIHYHDDQQYE